jgi:hypothetical protein
LEISLQTFWRFVDAFPTITKDKLTSHEAIDNYAPAVRSAKKRLNMRTILSVFVLTVATLLGMCPFHIAAAEEDGIALAIVYDTSGSMNEPVRNSTGSSSPKYVIANRALLAIVKQIQIFATNNAGGAPRKVDAGLFIFEGSGAKDVVKFGSFDAAAIQNWVTNFSKPNGSTPLGNALKTASQAVLDSPLPRKHVLVITDGMNTMGPEPVAVMPDLNRKAEQKQTVVFVHFIAFDVDAKVFSPLKKLGATVAGAADETQLNAQLDFILQNQILLEAPTKTK